MMKVRVLTFVVLLALLFAGCGMIRPSAEILSVKFVAWINASGGVMWTFEGFEIVEIKMDFAFDSALSDGLETSSDEYSDQLYKILVEGAHFYYQGEEVAMQYGYWPVKAGKNFANELTLYYLVPENPDSDQMRFVYDGALLGEGGTGIDTVLEPTR